MEVGSCKSEEIKDVDSHEPVPAWAHGEGLPYAPVDWPSQGDIWTWKVGEKVSSSGCYSRRFLYVPERLNKKNKKIYFQSKDAVSLYLQTEFPEADVSAFFESFTWEIPGKVRSMVKGETSPLPQTVTPKVEPRCQVTSRKRKSTRKCVTQSARNTNISQDQTSSSSGEEGTTTNSGTKSFDSAANENKHVVKLHVDRSQVQNDAGLSSVANSLPANTPNEHPADMTPEDFDNYLDSLHEILSQSTPKSRDSFSASSQQEVTKAREELSCLLAMDFPSLVNSDKLLKVTTLSSKLINDPTLSPGEHSMLNRVLEIPLASKHFSEAKQVNAEANKFFAELEGKIARITSLKEEYKASKENVAILQAEHEAASLTILKIDEQIAALQMRRDLLATAAKKNKTKIIELTATQKEVKDSVPKIVNEVQLANSERAEWELRQKKAVEQEEEILAKFAPLEGFSFMVQ